MKMQMLTEMCPLSLALPPHRAPVYRLPPRSARVQKLQVRAVTHLVRVCDPSYDIATLTAANIEVHDWPYPDGDPPPDEVINEFLALCTAAFASEGCIAVHCVAGLGR
jgi:protein tyrosine phosphatase type 4A